MVKMSRSYLQKGHMSLIWQDDVFFYSYFLWFEDSHGTQLKPKEIPNSASANAIKPHVVPGVIAGEFYQLVNTLLIVKLQFNSSSFVWLILLYLFCFLGG